MPGVLIGDTDMAAVPLFKDTNMAAVTSRDNTICQNNNLKGGAYYCYCAYVLRISRYSGFSIGNAFKYNDIFARFKNYP